MSGDDLIVVILEKHRSNLKSPDRKVRKQSLEELLKTILNDSNLTGKLDEIEKDVFKCFYDNSEAVRDSALNFIDEIIEKLPIKLSLLSEFIPIILSRLVEKDETEPSEELRLKSVCLLHKFLQKYEYHCGTYTDDIVTILVKTLLDSYPKIRKESCACVCTLSKLNLRSFYDHSLKLIKPVLGSFNHQHYRQRISAIEALGCIVKYGNNKNLPVQEVFGSLAERLFDSTPMVRSAVTSVIGDWLLNLPDRYSFFKKLIPLILTSLCDESEDIRNQAWKLWDKAGLQYLEENDDELKDKHQFLYEKPDHYPKNVTRPNLGCRTLVQRNTMQVIPALSKELEDWKDDIRVKSAQLLCWIVLHDETNITQHTESLLLIMYKVCNQKDVRVVENMEKAAEYIAYFVPPESYLKLVMPILGDTCTSGHLCVLSALLRGSNRLLLTPHLNSIAEFLYEDNVCRSRDSVYQMQLLKCCEALIDVCADECQFISRQLFVVMVTSVATASHQEVVDFGRELLDKLRLLCDVDSVEELYKCHVGCLLDKIESSADSWTPVSYERHILQCLMLDCGKTLGLFTTQLSRILVSVMNPECDASVRLKLFTLMSDMMYNMKMNLELCDQDSFNTFVLCLTEEVIVPNLVWHAGRTAEALRTAAVGCLYTTIIPSDSEKTVCSLHFVESVDVLDRVFATLLPLLLNTAEDTMEKTRLYTLKTLNGLVQLVRSRDLLTPDHVNLIYPVLCKRLDDVADDVRLQSLTCLQNIYNNLPLSYNKELYKLHLQQVYSAMLIHLDDSDEAFHPHMIDTLKCVGKIVPEAICEKIKTTRNHFRNKECCDELIEYFQQFLVS